MAITPSGGGERGFALELAGGFGPVAAEGVA